MKAICAADIHGDVGAVVKLRNSIASRDFDYVFLLGDYSRGFKDPAENRADVAMVLDALSGFTVKAIPGNCDQREAVEAFERRGASLHNAVLQLPEANIIGLGGSNITPFGTPLEFGEGYIKDALEGLHAMIDNSAPVILLTHFPPKDTACDLLPNGLHVGSEALRGFIEAKKPALALCAHIHECGGAEDLVGGTKVLNIGRISEGRAYALSVGDAVNIELYTGR
jgi:uncharacterized protein